jgi:dihydroorotate dehydrogenase
MLSFLYRRVLKPILFRFDPEAVHDAFVSLGEGLGRFGPGRGLVSALYGYRGPDASVTVDGLRYRTPVVLAAGFDYNGRLLRILPTLGFGGVEVGSVTALPTPGNTPPRMRRMVRSRAIVVNKGLMNQGVQVIAPRLARTSVPPDFVVGVSIARSNREEAATETAGIEDYARSLETLVREDVGDFYTINISCPNVHGGENFAEPERLRKLLRRLGQVEHDRPVYAKMPINPPWEEFRRLGDVIEEAGLHGLVIGNLNKDYGSALHPEEAPDSFQGGLSGLPCRERSTELVARSREAWGDRFTLIGCGGILSAEDALEKFRAGADLVHLISGMIFTGPHLMGEIADAWAREIRGIRHSCQGGTRVPDVVT